MKVPFSKLQNGYRDIDFNAFKNIENFNLLNSNPRNTIVFKNYKRYQNRFHQGYNKEAEFISFENNESYEKLSLSVNLYTPKDMAEKRKNRLKDRDNLNKITLESLYERGLKQRSGISVFLNGRKIKDTLVKISVFNGSTDVYIPSLLLNETDNEISIYTERYDSNFHYFSCEVIEGYKGGVPILTTAVDELEVFSEGKLINNAYAFVSMNGNIVALPNPSMDLTNVEIRSMGKTNRKENFYLSKPLFKLNDAKTPITASLMEVYIDGERFNIDKVYNLPDRMFLLDYEIPVGKTINIDIRQHLFPTDISKKHNFDNNFDKISRFLNYDKIQSILLDNTKIEGIPEFYNLETIREQYPPKTFKGPDPLNMPKPLPETLYELVKKYVGEDSHYLKLFLKHFLIPEVNYDYTYPDKSIYERLDTRSEISTKNVTTFKEKRVVYPFTCDFEDFVTLIKKNKKLIDPREFTIVKRPKTNYYFIYINSSIIEDDDLIEINIKRRTRYTEYKTLPVNGPSYKFDTIPYDEIADLEIALLPNEGNTFKLLDKEYYAIEENEDGRIHVELDVDSELYRQIMLFNPLTTGREIFIVTSSDPMTNTVIPINVVSKEGYKYPIFSSHNYKGNIEMYCQGQFLIEGKDYRILTPKVDNDLEDIEVVLTFVPSEGDVIEIFHKEYKQDLVANIEKIDSKYGFVFLKDLDFPFSFKYLDIYLNGKQLSEEHIEVIADNFIKLKNVNSLSNFMILERLLIDQPTLLDLINVIKNKSDSFESFIEKEIIEDKKDPDDWFEDLVDNDVINPNIPKDEIKPTDPDYVDERFDLGLHQLANALITGIISRRIDANKPDPELSKQPFYKYFTDNEIRIDCNQHNIRTDCIIDPNELYLTRAEVATLYGKEIVDGTFEMDVDGTILDSDPIYNYIYPENEIILDANIEIEEAIILDANVFIDSED